MANQTNFTESILLHSLSIFGSGSEGLVMCLGNGLLMATILFNTSLRQRKEMLIIVGLAAADLVFGLGALLLAVYRVVILLLGLQHRASTAWDCAKLPPVFLTIIGAQLNALMSFLVSADRYIAVANPIYYLSLSTNYSRNVLMSVSAYGLVVLTAMLSAIYFSDTYQNSTMNMMCFGSPLSGWFAIYQYNIILLVGFLAIFLYVGVFVKYNSLKRKIAPSLCFANQAAAAASQRQLTVTLGIITVSTLIFFIGPYSVFAFATWKGLSASQPATLGMISRFSTIINILIYVVRQKEIREGMKNIFRSKTSVYVV